MAISRKAVYVDGPWLYARREMLGLSRISFAMLKTILTIEIGSRLPVHEFVMTMKGGIGEIASSARRVGIEPIVVANGHDQDEELLIERIMALPSEVGEILVVTGDVDFHAALIEKHRQGVDLWIIGTREFDKDGCGVTNRAFFRSPYHFVDLAKFAERLEYGRPFSSTEESVSFLDLAPDNLPSDPASSSDNLIHFPGAGQIIAAGPADDQYRLTVEFTGPEAEVNQILRTMVEQGLILRSQVRVALQTEELA